MSFAKPIFTTRGKQIELQGIEGQQIIFTKIKIGDGRITTQSPSQLTDLINVIAEAPITSLKRYDAYAAIRSVFQNIDVPEAFWWREVGLFATDPATGEEVLYAYQNAYDTAEYITPSSLVTKKINWTIYIDDGKNLGADIHKKMVFCSVEDLDEHNDLEGAHEVAFDAHNADDGAHEPAFTAHNADTGSHPDIRNKIGTDISSHNTSTSAHTDIRNSFNEFVKGVTGSNATLTITKGNGTTSTVTVNNVANAGVATKATQDSVGQQINSTYIKGLSISSQTITYTKGNDTTGTITVPTGAGAKSYITESVVNSDGSWYRKYSDGWLEQGGQKQPGTTGDIVLSFLHPFANDKYVIVANCNYGQPSAGYAPLWTNASKTSISTRDAYGYGFSWMACGMGAK